MAKHGDTERHILSLFKNAQKFEYKGELHTILTIGKPAPPKGECKTDIYIKTQKTDGSEFEFKISVKQSNADFLENKITLERALEIFGVDAQEIIRRSTGSIRSSFEKDFYINFSKLGRTESNSIKIGWKFEFTNKYNGNKSALIELTPQQKIDVYSGTNLSESKRNSSVSGTKIIDSGVANFILERVSLEKDLNYYLEKLEDINIFAIQQDIYFACKAINYRMAPDKWDGNRPLAVYCNWFINSDNKLDMNLIFENPLYTRANEIGFKIRKLLSHLGIKNENFIDIEKVITKDIILHK